MGSLIVRTLITYIEAHPEILVKLIEALLPHLVDHVEKQTK